MFEFRKASGMYEAAAEGARPDHKITALARLEENTLPQAAYDTLNVAKVLSEADLKKPLGISLIVPAEFDISEREALDLVVGGAKTGDKNTFVRAIRSIGQFFALQEAGAQRLKGEERAVVLLSLTRIMERASDSLERQAAIGVAAGLYPTLTFKMSLRDVVSSDPEVQCRGMANHIWDIERGRYNEQQKWFVLKRAQNILRGGDDGTALSGLATEVIELLQQKVTPSGAPATMDLANLEVPKEFRAPLNLWAAVGLAGWVPNSGQVLPAQLFIPPLNALDQPHLALVMPRIWNAAEKQDRVIFEDLISKKFTAKSAELVMRLLKR